MNAQELHGWLVLDKPRGITSRDAVNRIQTALPRGVKIGHTGTLDPLATGVLVLAIGHATRLAEYVQAMHKTYLSTFLLGATSDTDDADGVVQMTANAQPESRNVIVRILQGFVGEIDQVPPAYSAAKVEGRRAYSRARAGEDVELQSRRVHVYGIEVVGFTWPRIEIEVRCGKGTYIRSLARDLGQRLGCGGLVESLRRTRVGQFTVDEAISIDADLNTIHTRLKSLMAGVDDLPKVEVSPETAAKIRHGQSVCAEEGASVETAVVCRGRLVAIAHRKTTLLKPVKVIPDRMT